MKKNIHVYFLILLLIYSANYYCQEILIDHNCTKINQIPEFAIIDAKNNLHIAYGHTSHGSQIITGMNNLDLFMGGTGLYAWNDGPQENFLDIDDYFTSGDLGNPDRETWADRTREYLNNPSNSDVNVVIWSWCGQVSSATEENINTYLNHMKQLEIDYPSIKFVYMTGHLDGSGLNGNLHIRNEQIRNYCASNNKILYDFADIESYDPDGNYFADKIPNDNCDYDTNGDETRDGNWALEWQQSHSEGIDWYNCSSAHSQPLNANQKAYAAWWLWSVLAGWQSTTTVITNFNIPLKIELKNNYPNPFNPKTIIEYSIKSTGLNSESLNETLIKLSIFDILGKKVETLISERQGPGNYLIEFDALHLTSGIYFYTLETKNYIDSKCMIFLK